MRSREELKEKKDLKKSEIKETKNKKEIKKKEKRKKEQQNQIKNKNEEVTVKELLEKKDIKNDDNKKNKKIIIIFISIIVLIISCVFLFFKFYNKKIYNDNKSSETTNTEGVNDDENDKDDSNEKTPTEPETPSQSTEQTPPSSDNNSGININSIYTLKTGYNPLDNYVSQILSNITSPNASATNRLYAIYNYVKNNMVYDMFPPTDSGIYESLISYGYSSYDAQQMTLAYNAAKYKHGVCDNYAALIMILARASGIEVWQYGGATASGTSHAWNIIYVNGEKYLVDANYGIFMKPFSSSGYTEQMDGRSYFNYFKIAAPTVEEKKISWLFNAGYSDQRFYGNSRGKITQTATINRPMYTSPGTIYPAPITPLVNLEGSNNSFSATVSSGGVVIEKLKEQSGSNQNYTFSWYPPEPGSYVFEIVATSDGIFEGHFIIYANIS